MKKLKSNKGITLVALIITIIVLLILAGVTIKLIVDNGIVGRATGAKNKYTVAEEKELIQLAYSNYKMGIAEGNPFIEDKNLLERYFLGEDRQGKPFYDLVYNPTGSNLYPTEQLKFKDNNIIKDASTSITMLESIYNGSNDSNVMIEYNNNIWKVTIQNRGSIIGEMTIGVEFVLTISEANKSDIDQEALEKYFLGTDKQGLDLFSLVHSPENVQRPDDVKFKNNDIIEDANTTISVLGVGQGELIEGDGSGSTSKYSSYFLIEYKANIYKMFAIQSQQDNTYLMLTTKVEFVTSISVPSESQLMIKGAKVEGNEDTGWIITFNKTGNVYTLASTGKVFGGVNKTEDLVLLKKYFLGANGEGKLISDVCHLSGGSSGTASFDNIYGFKNDANSIKNASTKISLLFSNYSVGSEKSNNYIKYNDIAYKVEINKEGRILSVELAYAPTGREGQKVTYSYDGTTENEKEWTILYDYGDSVEIISPEVMGSLTLGKYDTEAQTPGDIDKDGTANTDVDKAIYSYNNAVNRINAYASSFVTNSNKISVRSVGSNSDDPNNDNSGMYSSNDLETLNSRYNGIGKDGDNNGEEDILRMSYFSVGNTVNTGSGSVYYIPSRTVGKNSYDISFSVRFVSASIYGSAVNLFERRLWYVNEQNAYAENYSYSYEVRPVVKISSKDIK